MNKDKWFLVVIAMSLVALIGSAAGCEVAAPAAPVPKPTINSFTASPTSISQGERTTLSWDVSGTTTVTIEPAIGTVGPSGSLTLTPDASVNYTLTATNEAGSDAKSVSVAVAPVVAGKPDLVITDFWLYGGDQLNYKVANIGNADSEPSHTYLYFGYTDEGKQTVTWIKSEVDWLDPIPAGEEITTFFPNLEWEYQLGVIPESSFTTGIEAGYDMRICADAENEVAESDEANNCLIQIWRMGFDYDFLDNAHLATWRSSHSINDLRWPMVTEDPKGAVVRDHFSPFMTICPEQASDGWILGRYGELYTEFGKTMMRAFTVPVQAKFTAKLGFAPGAESSDGVRFALGYTDDMGSTIFFPKMDVSPDGQLHDYEVDLSDLAGKKTEFFLLVEAKGSPDATDRRLALRRRRRPADRRSAGRRDGRTAGPRRGGLFRTEHRQGNARRTSAQHDHRRRNRGRA